MVSLRSLVVLLLASGVFAQTEPSNPGSPVGDFANGLVRAYLNYEGTGTSIKDFSTNNATGSTSGIQWGSDAEGYYVIFDPIDSDYMDGGNGGLSEITSAFTLLVRFRSNTTLAGRNIVGISIPTGTTNTSRLRAYLQGGVNRVDICFNTGTDACYGHSTNTAIVIGTWYTFCASYNNADDSVKVTIDGVRKLSSLHAAGGNIGSMTGYNFFQARYGAAKSADVDIHYVFLWNRELTNEEKVAYSSNPYAYFGDAVAGRRGQARVRAPNQ